MTTHPPKPVSPLPRFALTMGDAAGIGPEIIVKAWQAQPALFRQTLVLGDVQVFRQACQQWAPHVRVVAIHDPTNPSEDWVDLASGVLPVWGVVALPQPTVLGQTQKAYGAAAARCVQLAAQMALREQVSAVVTAPLHKDAMHLAGVAFVGHTEMLAHEAAQALGQPDPVPVRMMLMNPELRVVLHTVHVPLAQAILSISIPKLLETLLITHRALYSILGRPARIAVAGLNPHAGENGLMGREEIDVIRPAVVKAQAMGIQVDGPHPPDTVFMSARAGAGKVGSPDVVVAMYHDQGLIPVKYMGLDQGVNVTLGLPFVRTSPDHGTAFDIAGQGIARCDSLLAAMQAARQLVGSTVSIPSPRLRG